MTTTLERHSLTIEGGVASAKASAWARALGERYGLPEELAYAMDLCIVELVTNIVDHAYGENPGAIRLELDVGPEAAILSIIDDGPPFNPLSVPPPNTAASIEDATIGGYGIHMVRETADGCRYERRNGQNVFTAYFGIGADREALG